jgi:hypothetical protein
MRDENHIVGSLLQLSLPDTYETNVMVLSYKFHTELQANHTLHSMVRKEILYSSGFNILAPYY